jgi:predicted ATPase/transcriptional regulator with XRE-family HTH domain
MLTVECPTLHLLRHMATPAGHLSRYWLRYPNTRNRDGADGTIWEGSMEHQHSPTVAVAHATFGDLLRHLRRQAYMTQRDLALATGYSIGQICRFEQNQFVPDLPTLTARFLPALVQASDTATAERLLALADTARVAQRERQRHPPRLLLLSKESRVEHDPALALPPLPLPATPLLGRGQEVAQVCALLQQTMVRLLTLTGAPGIGKTRLGLQVAADLQTAFADGMAFVPLAPISDPALVLITIAQTLGVQERAGQAVLDSLKSFLSQKRLLLLLDNFEQLIVAAPLVGELLAAAPRLKVLVTSRRPLHLSGEQEFAVAPLALPPRSKNAQASTCAATLTQYAAVQLFIARAQAVKADFGVTDATAVAIAEICHRLDGLPLAIELAAARIKLFPPQALMTRLKRRLQLLTAGAQDLPARQQTLRATIDWSYQLLGAGEQTLLARLGVFVGGCTLQAAETICTALDDPPPDVLDRLAALVDQSLVRQAEGLDGEPRFTLLETIREYALERLEASGETEALQRRHADYYLALAEQAEPAMLGAEQGVWMEWLAAEHDNLRAGLRWALDRNQAQTSGRLAGALSRFWYTHGHISEGRSWLEAVLSQDGALPPELRVKVLTEAGRLAGTQGDYRRGFALLEESLALGRANGDRAGIALALHVMGRAAFNQGDYVRAQPLLEESLALLRELGDMPRIAACLAGLGSVALSQNDHPRAKALSEEGLVLSRAVAAHVSEVLCLINLGGVALEQGDPARAHSYLAAGLELGQEGGYKEMMTALCLFGLATVATMQGEARRAARLAGVVETLLADLGTPLPQAIQSRYALVAATIRAQLGETAFAAAWTEGQRMPLEQAIAEALSHND